MLVDEFLEALKMTLPCSGSTIVECSVQIALESCSRVILVSGYRGKELARLFVGRDRVLVVHNSDYELDMFSSVQCAHRPQRSRQPHPRDHPQVSGKDGHPLQSFNKTGSIDDIRPICCCCFHIPYFRGCFASYPCILAGILKP